MNTQRKIRCLAGFAPALLLVACSKTASPSATDASAPPAAAPAAGQSAVADNDSQKDIVKVAIGSQAHTTLVTAVQAADLVDVLSNAGPFTVFAPTNEAFKKLPTDTVASLLKPANKEQLRDILQYHVAVAVYRPDMLKDGMTLNMANGDNVKIAVKDGRIVLNGTATVVGTVPAANGIIHVLDGVLTPPAGH
jgi:uncharacterized surface protein with fasciclin (FAS1) repeats